VGSAALGSAGAVVACPPQAESSIETTSRMLNTSKIDLPFFIFFSSEDGKGFSYRII
jgi:hypothetical protein